VWKKNEGERCVCQSESAKKGNSQSRSKERGLRRTEKEEPFHQGGRP